MDDNERDYQQQLAMCELIIGDSKTAKSKTITPIPTALNRCYLLHVLFMQAGIPTPRADAYDAHEIARLDAANEERINGQD